MKKGRKIKPPPFQRQLINLSLKLVAMEKRLGNWCSIQNPDIVENMRELNKLKAKLLATQQEIESRLIGLEENLSQQMKKTNHLGDDVFSLQRDVSRDKYAAETEAPAPPRLTDTLMGTLPTPLLVDAAGASSNRIANGVCKFSGHLIVNMEVRVKESDTVTVLRQKTLCQRCGFFLEEIRNHA